MRLRANKIPMLPNGLYDTELPVDLVLHIKAVLINGVARYDVVEACEEHHWAIIYTGDWDEINDNFVTKRLDNVDVKFVFDDE